MDVEKKKMYSEEKNWRTYYMDGARRSEKMRKKMSTVFMLILIYGKKKENVHFVSRFYSFYLFFFCLFCFTNEGTFKLCNWYYFISCCQPYVKKAVLFTGFFPSNFMRVNFGQLSSSAIFNFYRCLEKFGCFFIFVKENSEIPLFGAFYPLA